MSKHKQPIPFAKRVWVKSTLCITLLSVCGVFLLTPAAQAQFGAPQATFDYPNILNRDAWNTKQEAKVGLEDSLLAAALGGLVEAASFFFRRLAYDTATYVASGGKGQGRLIFDDPGKYFSEVGGDAIASGIGELGKPFGLNLCQVPDLRVNLYLQVGLKMIYGQGPPTPNCRWQDLTNGGIFDTQAWDDRYGSTEKLADTFSTSLSVDNTDFGVAMGAVAQVDRLRVQKEKAASDELIANQGFKPITDLITGQVLTPGQTIQEETKKLTATHQGEISSQQIAGIYGAGALQIIPSAMSVFLNTLTSQLLQEALSASKGLFPASGGGSEGVSNIFAADIVDNRIAAQAAYNKLFTAVPSKQLTDYDIVSEFAACPPTPGLNNCVIDTDLQRALVQASTGNPLTIREALEKNLLHRDWPLISPRRESDHTDIRGCQVGRYCYGNLQKLRKVRILPMGFEVAALRSDPERPWTLGQVVDNFETCMRDEAGNVIPDARFPFCHLIDPNWIIRSPVVRCESKVFGQQLINNLTPERREECVDFSTCLNEGPGGTCIDGQYAYCTKEKNIWRIGAEECPAHFNTCLTFTNTENSQVVSYLTNTLDYGQCSEDSVGCRAYSLEQEGETWISSPVLNALPNQDIRRGSGRNSVVYFNKKIYPLSGDCVSENSNGCRAFYTAAVDESGQFVKENNQFIRTEGLAHLQKAPDYLGCYDTNRADVRVQWPTTAQEASNAVSQDPRCDAFASVCAPEEVGCEAFIPLQAESGEPDGGPVIPGIVGSANVCPASCSGYDTFKQVGYLEAGAGFEAAKFPLHFIPSQAQSCSAALVGCDEFTNIDDVSRGGEAREYYSELRYCERPSGEGADANARAFYTWEGSVTDGFQLRTYSLLKIDAEERAYIDALQLQRDAHDIPADFFAIGTPAYNDDSYDGLLDAYRKCNEQSYQQRLDNPYHPNAADPNCRAMFDDAGNISYRLADRLVTVSDACHRIRKTEPSTLVDTHIPNAETCQNRSGYWDAAAGECYRCTNGGVYESGSCIYQTIAAESASCSGPAENPAAYAGCRAYVGNDGRNVELVFHDDFEAISEEPDALLAARGQWQNGEVSADAVDVGGHSLRVQGIEAARLFGAGELEPGSAYQLTFWARGGASMLSVSLANNEGGEITDSFTVDPVTGQDRLVPIGGAWREYTLGPVVFSGQEDDEMMLYFLNLDFGENPGDGPRPERIGFFLDHVQLRKLPSNLYLVKNSWKGANGADAPAQCDSNPNDDIPGEMLGCSPYQVESNGEVRYATGFEKLCRPKAIGCQPFWDTHNTVVGEKPRQAHAYNVWCPGAEGTVCRVLSSAGAGAPRTEVGSCTVGQAQEGCWVDEVILPLNNVLPEEYIQSATILISQDTPDATPIFLADREEFRCRESERGCSQIGLETQNIPVANAAASYSHETIMLKNDPALYAETLCRPDQVGCGEFRAGNETRYFKDPVLNGNSLCYYKPPTGRIQDEVHGWFKVGVGQCVGGPQANALCRADGDCGEGGRCTDIGSIECADGNFRRAGGYSDIRTNGSEGYAGLVGQCADQYNRCTELIDPADTDVNGNEGKPYYVIFDENVEGRVEQCEGRVSLNEGCVLFDRTEEPNKRFDSAATYAASEAANPKYAPVAPVSNAATNDANLILKVDRDRACSEWLACKSAIPHVGEDGRKVELCYQYAACNDTEPGVTCTNWVSDIENIPGAPESSSRLTYENYIRRGTSWYDQEYVGYSLFDKYQINDLVYIGFEPGKYQELIDPRTERVREEYRGTEAFVAYRQPEYRLPEELGCKVTSGPDEGTDKEDWTSCGVVQDGVRQGRCYRGQCIYPVHKAFSSTIDGAEDVSLALKELEVNSCKSTPEQDSPFPSAVGGEPIPLGTRRNFIEPPTAFSKANFCQDGSCSCSYLKVDYANGTRDYWSANNDGTLEIPTGICVAGEEEGMPCTENADCGEDEDGRTILCAKQKKKETHIGFDGFCLEYDLSRPIHGQRGTFACLTWLPIEVSASAADLFNADQTAGYQPSEQAEGFGQVYCSQSTQVASRPHEFAGVQKTVRGERAHVFEFFNNDATDVGGLWGRFLDDPDQADGYGNNEAQLYNPWLPLIGGLWREYQDWLHTAEWPPLEDDGVTELPQEEWPRPGGTSDENWEEQPAWVTFLEEKKRRRDGGRNDWRELDGLAEIFENFVNDTLEDNPNFFWVESNVFQPDLSSPGYGHPDEMDRRACDDTGEPVRGDYRHLFCEAIDAQLLAGLVQKWAWEHTKKGNMLVLRSEIGFDYEETVQVCENVNGQQQCRGEEVTQEDGVGALSVQHGYINAPEDGDLFPTMLVPYGVDQHGPTLGTLMHPPRFGANGRPVEHPGPSAFWYDGENGKRLRTAALSPGTALNTSNAHERVARGLWRSQAEGFIRKSDIHRLYFVPTAILGGMDGQWMPPMYTTDFRIDVTALDNKENGQFIEGAYRATFCHKRGGADNANEEFPRMVDSQDPGGCEGKYGRPVEKTAALWTYKQSGGFFTYGDLQGRGGDLDGGPINHSRNEVAERYVAVYMNPTEGNPFLRHVCRDQGCADEQLLKGLSAETDPFAIDCTGDNLAAENSWFAIGIDFNQDGEFLGYVTRYCNYDDREGAPLLTVVAELNDQCTEFNKVYDPSGGGEGPLKGTTNKAWTNRLWSGALAIDGESPMRHALARYGNPAAGDEPVDRTTLRALYGSLEVEPEHVDTRADARKILRSYTFRSATNGIPYACFDKYFNLPYALDQNVRRCAALRSADEMYSAGLIDTLTGNTVAQGRDAIFQLFAKVFTRVAFTTDRGIQANENNYEVAGAAPAEELDRSDDIQSALPRERLIPPQIYSLNPFRCFNEDSDHPCTVGERDNITINGKNGTDEDYDRDGFSDEISTQGEPDVIIGEGSQRVVAQFFAFADDNRMPIRRVLVKWGSGSRNNPDIAPPLQQKGLYKNRKPYCERSNDGGLGFTMGMCAGGNVGNEIFPTGLTCIDPNAPGECPTDMACLTPNALQQAVVGNRLPDTYLTTRFGNIQDACKEGYFEFTHEYVCDRTDQNNPNVWKQVSALSQGTQNRLVERGLALGDFVCVYKPGVQVLDNWDHCNGSVVAAGQPLLDVNGEVLVNQAGYWGGDCERLNEAKAWTYYKGEIVVIPRREE